MKFNEKDCKFLIEDAFKGSNTIPECNVEAFNKFIGEFSDNYQLAMRYRINGLPYAKIGDMLGITGNRARQIYLTCLGKIVRYIRFGMVEESGTFTLETSVMALDLSNRTRYTLLRARIQTIGDIVKLTSEDLISLSNFGQKSLEEIKSALSARGFELAKSDVKEVVKYNVNIGFGTQVNQDSLNSVYEICKDRIEKYGFGLACKGCRYRGVNGSDCMFNWQPRLWDASKIIE